jgi:predicted amidohydrolase
VNPWGDVIADITCKQADVACASIDLQKQQQMRERFPALTHRRMELF